MARTVRWKNSFFVHFLVLLLSPQLVDIWSLLSTQPRTCSLHDKGFHSIPHLVSRSFLLLVEHKYLSVYGLLACPYNIQLASSLVPGTLHHLQILWPNVRQHVLSVVSDCTKFYLPLTEVIKQCWAGKHNFRSLFHQATALCHV
jgi:hypothetical protein